MNDLDAMLDQFETSLGLPARVSDGSQSVAHYMSMSKAELRGLQADDCSEIALVLQQFAFHLQRATNLEKGRADWCVDNIHAIIAPTVGQMKGYSFDERKLLAVRQNDAAMRLDALRVKCQARLNRVAFLAQKVEVYSKKFSDLAETKRRQHG